ncbi:MAG: hypothetical protein AAB422_07025 [Planctomycetota bacterium]
MSINKEATRKTGGFFTFIGVNFESLRIMVSGGDLPFEDEFFDMIVSFETVVFVDGMPQQI